MIGVDRVAEPEAVSEEGRPGQQGPRCERGEREQPDEHVERHEQEDHPNGSRADARRLV
jgi:hypothetical protein